ncbi:MAG: nucleotide exchange factor GrpE, partial [Lysobacterales bacterium CG_4_10_14_3_um_filter_64_11]
MQNQTDPTAAETSADNPAVSDESAVAGDERLNAALAELQQLREQSLRERAELENQRRRMQRDVDSARRFANERLLGDLLPVIDSLKAGLGADVADTARLREGMELTLRQLLKMASDHGLQTVHPVGLPFNPEQHQAMSLLPSPEHAPGTV